MFPQLKFNTHQYYDLLPYCAGIPSIQEEKRLKTEEKNRIELQKQQLGVYVLIYVLFVDRYLTETLTRMAVWGFHVGDLS